MTQDRNSPPSQHQSTQPEDDFISLFADLFGLEKTPVLVPEFPILDIEGTARYIDFALRAGSKKIAFEIDGPTHYQPPAFDRTKYEDDHTAADSDQQVLAYFRPVFTLDLTASPERPDGKPILDIFRDTAHRLSLKDAIEQGELVPIRCVRVKTNVDLTRVRFNEVQYHRQDLEQAITIPARDALIVQTYLEHVRGRKAVTFAVNIRHGEALAERYSASGIPARAVSGQMPNKERDAILTTTEQEET